MDSGIISKERVKQYGEVFTPDSIVCDMIDLVEKQWGNISDAEYILKTYLEPACGDGQFLIRLLSRKLERVAKLPVEERELALVKAISSIYGVDIQDDNVNRSRERMLNIIEGKAVPTFDLNNDNEIQIDLGIDINSKLKKLLKEILEENIILGNTLETVELFEYKFELDQVQVRKFNIIEPDDLYKWSKKVKYIKLGELLTEQKNNNNDIDGSYEF